MHQLWFFLLLTAVGVYVQVPDTKGKQTAQLLSATKERARVEKNDSNGQAPNQDTAAADDFSTLKDDDPENMEALIVLREQLDKLHNLLSEKDEALKSAEESMKQMSTVNSTLDALKRDIAEKEFLLTSVNSHLSNSEVRNNQCPKISLSCRCQL